MKRQQSIEEQAATEDVAEESERELEAQLAIVRALKPLSQDNRRRIILAANYILEADQQVNGMFEAVARGLKQKS